MPKPSRISPKRRTITMEDMGEELIGEVTVVDVYDIASEIGKECEKIIDQFGADAVTSLMPKVINALEHLEYLATKNERENTHLAELKLKIVQLENEKLEKAEYRRKFEKELEAIEEQWRLETKELVSAVSRLQEENRRLAKQDLKPLKDSPETGDGLILQRLQTALEKQRGELRIKEACIQEKCNDIDKLKSQVERLKINSRELSRKHKSFQSQVRQLCDERADFLVQLKEQQRDLIGLRQQLGLAQKENEDLTKSSPTLPSNLIVYNVDDPNRPRFTTSELKDILHERNELKARVSDLEDELETYRPKEKIQTENIRSIETKHEQTFSSGSINVENVEISDDLSKEFPVIDVVSVIDPVDEDAPVQGPLPYEPDDAPWKRTASSESGIRKLLWSIIGFHSFEILESLVFET
nr:RILP-like protein homolog isoform X2 [Onthophagus taurus]